MFHKVPLLLRPISNDTWNVLRQDCYNDQCAVWKQSPFGKSESYSVYTLESGDQVSMFAIHDEEFSMFYKTENSYTTCSLKKFECTTFSWIS